MDELRCGSQEVIIGLVQFGVKQAGIKLKEMRKATLEGTRLSNFQQLSQLVVTQSSCQAV
jgi:hypothetical protein